MRRYSLSFPLTCVLIKTVYSPSIEPSTGVSAIFPFLSIARTITVPCSSVITMAPELVPVYEAGDMTSPLISSPWDVTPTGIIIVWN